MIFVKKKPKHILFEDNDCKAALTPAAYLLSGFPAICFFLIAQKKQICIWVHMSVISITWGVHEKYSRGSDDVTLLPKEPRYPVSAQS